MKINNFNIHINSIIIIFKSVWSTTSIIIKNKSESINDEDVLILKNHGVICVGDSLKEAKLLAIFVEESAKTQFITYMLNSVED